MFKRLPSMQSHARLYPIRRVPKSDRNHTCSLCVVCSRSTTQTSIVLEARAVGKAISIAEWSPATLSVQVSCMLMVYPTHIFAYVVSSRVRLLISAAPANGALKASVQYPMIPMSLTRSFGLMALKCVVPERMLCMSAAEGEVMVIMMYSLCVLHQCLQASNNNTGQHLHVIFGVSPLSK